MKLFSVTPTITEWQRRNLGKALANEQRLQDFLGHGNAKSALGVDTLRRLIVLEVEGKNRNRLLGILIVRMQKLERKELEKKIAKHTATP